MTDQRLLWWNRFRYTLYTPVYDWIVGSFQSKRKQSIEQLQARPEDPVLLIGAGTGLDLPFLLKFTDITAVAITPAMLRRLESRARQLELAVTTKVMDGARLEFEDASFRVVVLHLILAVMPDPRACLQEVVRVLEPGGEVVVFDKFLPDDRRAGPLRRVIDALARFLATSINRQTRSLLEDLELEVHRDEPVAWGGLFRILYLRKPRTGHL